ncbi:NHL repeat-containing protein [Leptospira brenneri]|uniref:NHL repeat-containing protein n=1 Tax=Leptospira brenneri TaxID=2023182 RepID=UPI000C2B264D|nr:NHL repeat-containing protein [Leptospira brenneri]PJZ47425.1 hypothetical protein CH361_02240 [Leptospira brenneri]
MASLSNPCDSESKDFIPQLIASASIEGGFCQMQVVNTGDLYRYTDFTFYKSIPISVLPRLGSKREVSVRPELPEGLYIDPNTGALSGMPNNVLERQSYTVYRKGVVQGQITIQIRDLVATQVYGQFGSFTCGALYNSSGCTTSAAANANNLSGPNAVITDNSGGVYIASGNRVLYYPVGQTTATRVYGQHGLFNCDMANAHTNQTCNPLGGVAATTLSAPRGLLIDVTNNLFVTDTGVNRRILIYPNESTLPIRALGVSNFNTPGGGATSSSVFYTPSHLSPDSNGGFYLSDSGDSRVLYFPKDASLPSEVYGQPNFASNGATASDSGLSTNQGVVADSTGGIYIADTGNNRVVYYPKGSNIATRVYGQINFTDSGPPSGASSNSLNYPLAVALDQSENLFVADYTHHRVLVYPPTNLSFGMTASAVVGQFGDLNCEADNNSGSCSIGTPTAQNLYRPSAIHFDKQGKMYITDYGNNRVLVY